MGILLSAPLQCTSLVKREDSWAVYRKINMSIPRELSVHTHPASLRARRVKMNAPVIFILNFASQIQHFRRIVMSQNVVGLRMMMKAEENVCQCIQHLHQHRCHPQRIQLLVLRSRRVKIQQQRLLCTLLHHHLISHRVNRVYFLQHLHLSLQHIHHHRHHLRHRQQAQQTNQAHCQLLLHRCHPVTLLRQSQQYHHQVFRQAFQAHLRLFLPQIDQALLRRLSPVHLHQPHLATLRHQNQQSHHLLHLQLSRQASLAQLRLILPQMNQVHLHRLHQAALHQLHQVILHHLSQLYRHLPHLQLSQQASQAHLHLFLPQIDQAVLRQLSPALLLQLHQVSLHH